MSDTPPTDEAMTGYYDCPEHLVKRLEGICGKLERELTEAKAKADNAKTALLTITAGHFYQSSCRGGEMERLMNQAIEILGGKQ